MTSDAELGVDRAEYESDDGPEPDIAEADLEEAYA